MKKSAMTRVTRLENGLTVATSQMPQMASVSVGIWVAVGGRCEPAGISGVSHFIEHLLFKGTKKRSAREISQAVEGIGGYLNAFTGEETTCFYSKARHDRLGELVDVLCDMFLESTFVPAEIEKERDVIREELAMYLDQPHQHVHELLNETLWPEQPLGRSLTGTTETLKSITRSQLLAFRQSNYVAGATLIAAAGNVSHARLLREAKRFGSRFSKGTRPAFSPAQERQSAPRLRLWTKKVEQTHLALGIRTCSRHDERRFSLRVLNAILGENMSSRLFQVVREDHGLAYNIYSQLGFFEDTGDLVISAGLDTGHLEKTLKLILRELRQLVETPVTASEMRRARDYLIGQIELSLESTENQMMWLGEQWMGYGRIISPAEIKRRIAGVTSSQVRAAARDFFRPSRLNLALVSPLKNEKSVSKLLRL